MDGFEFVRGEQSVGMTAVGFASGRAYQDFKQPNNAQGAGLVERMQGNRGTLNIGLFEAVYADLAGIGVFLQGFGR